MPPRFSRRRFVAAIGTAAAASAVPFEAMVSRPKFKLSVITDEISQDFGHALEVASKDFGCSHVELREMWNKNLMHADANELAEARRLLERYKLGVACIASPLFKVDWPGAPQSTFSPKRDLFRADFTFKQQDELLNRATELAKTFNTNRVRCFDFWRLDDQKPHRAAMDEKLKQAAIKAGKRNVILVVENEPSCNTATSAEAARLLDAIQVPSLMLNWDPGNAASRGETPYPDGYKLLPKDRIGHIHCKDVIRNAGGQGFEYAPVGKGVIDFVGIFKALKKNGYRHAVSLETHWRGAGSAEASSRISMAGLKDALKRAGAL
ncbi:MAG TPA: sugar phosphate isomerase/epimerase family protein [Acidobacteriota bacterium]|jgi:sugar phosphate isomerase/epimerase|nr:sugar phosphate isomerase/epimerase family protein [Acidobacteriota bacterium]